MKKAERFLSGEEEPAVQRTCHYKRQQLLFDVGMLRQLKSPQLGGHFLAFAVSL